MCKHTPTELNPHVDWKRCSQIMLSMQIILSGYWELSSAQVNTMPLCYNKRSSTLSWQLSHELTSSIFVTKEISSGLPEKVGGYDFVE